MPNSYTFVAQYFPAFLLTMPMYLLLHSFSINVDKVLIVIDEMSFSWGEFSISSSIALWFFFVYVIRFLAKHFIENKIFDNGKKFPTTHSLAIDSEFMSQTRRTKVLALIQSDFGISTIGFNTLSEEDKTIEAKEYVSLIRRRVGNGTLTLEHLRRYGFIRNFIGGLFIVLPILLVNAGYVLYQSKYDLINIVLLLCAIFLAMVFIFRKNIINKYANEYSSMLFDDYINLDRSV